MVKLEVIKELALKANLEMCGCGCDMPTKQSLKFAELIVLECADWIDEQDESRCPWSRDLIRHFGVKA